MYTVSLLFTILNILLNTLYNRAYNSTVYIIKDIKQHIQLYEGYIETFNYCLENDYVYDILYFEMNIAHIECIPTERNCCNYNIHIVEPYDSYITKMCIQLDNSYILAKSPLKTLFNQEITEIWKYNRVNDSRFIITILVDYFTGKLDYYKKILKLRSKYGML